jgi:hypothetical protein
MVRMARRRLGHVVKRMRMLDEVRAKTMGPVSAAVDTLDVLSAGLIAVLMLKLIPNILNPFPW